ncbi:ANK [Mytilus edulis]|uniref:ANK n=1 Tax=Mytilus edulis TaxID=6550 RepID=A0A8S3SWI1_MYTED|nr:ANK [Mytilus edulis]
MATASCSSFMSTSSTVTNYARLGLATQNELPNILRELLLIKEPPHLLEAHLNNNSYLSRNLRAHEWNIIRTVRTNQYNEFDVPLMYKIIRNLNLVPSPTQGWDNQTPPSSTEITVGDDIERIRRIRNEIVHRGNTNVQDPELANYFSFFKDIARRLEVALMLSNREFVSKMENAETCCIDEDTERHYIKRLRELEKYETELAINFAEVRKDLVCLRSQNQIKKEIDKWKQDDIKYVPTNASKYLLHRDKAEQSHLSRITEMDKSGLEMGSLEACCWEGYVNLLPWFVDQGVEINRCSTCSLTPLAFACVHSRIELINTLLNLGADINKQGILGYTPLHIMFDSNADPAVLDLLLKNKPCINKRMYDGATPLL